MDQKSHTTHLNETTSQRYHPPNINAILCILFSYDKTCNRAGLHLTALVFRIQTTPLMLLPRLYEEIHGLITIVDSSLYTATNLLSKACKRRIPVTVQAPNPEPHPSLNEKLAVVK